MITRACGFIQFDTERDFNKQVLEYADKTLRFEGEGIERPNRFPAVYKYQEPWDSYYAHFGGYWELCEDSEPMLKAITDEVTELLKVWKKVAEPIDSKQNL